MENRYVIHNQANVSHAGRHCAESKIAVDLSPLGLRRGY